MAGTKAGGLKAKAKNLEKNPNFYKEIGAKGGSAEVPKGFALNRERAKLAGAKGGAISRRGKSVKKEAPKKERWPMPGHYSDRFA